MPGPTMMIGLTDRPAGEKPPWFRGPVRHNVAGPAVGKIVRAHALKTPLPELAGPSTTATVTLQRAPDTAVDDEIE